jgi:protein gp37
MSATTLWHDAVPDEFIAAVWTTMFWTSAEGRPGRRKPRHTYQILTKRPGRMRSWVRR